MKNPLKKEDSTGLIIGLAAGVAAGIGLGYLYLTKQGKNYRKQIVNRFKEEVSDQAAGVIAKKTIIPKKAAKIATDTVVK